MAFGKLGLMKFLSISASFNFRTFQVTELFCPFLEQGSVRRVQRMRASIASAARGAKGAGKSSNEAPRDSASSRGRVLFGNRTTQSHAAVRQPRLICYTYACNAAQMPFDAATMLFPNPGPLWCRGRAADYDVPSLGGGGSPMGAT